METMELTPEVDQEFNKAHQNIILQRYHFNKRSQLEHETIQEYVDDLEQLALFCEFADLTESLIRDRLVCDASEEFIVTQLLSDPDLTLEKAIGICESGLDSKSLTHGDSKRELILYRVEEDGVEHELVVCSDKAYDEALSFVQKYEAIEDNDAAFDEDGPSSFEYAQNAETVGYDPSSQEYDQSANADDDADYDPNYEVEDENADPSQQFQSKLDDVDSADIQDEMAEFKNSKTKLYKCEICGAVMTRAHRLKVHMMIHSDVKPHSCSICDKTFRTGSNLKKHMVVHDDVEDCNLHVCDQCGAGFKRVGGLKNHMLTHITVGDHVCHICGKHSKTSGDLRRHVATHTTQPFTCTCPDCGKPFTRTSYLAIHRRSHQPNTDKPFKCTICGQGCITSSVLLAHMRKHSVDRPFRCKLCEFASKSRGDLKKHMLTHGKHKGFLCKICDKSFLRADVLKRHMVTHGNARPFQCKICQKTFKVQGGLKRHRLTHDANKGNDCAMRPRRTHATPGSTNHITIVICDEAQ